MLVGVEAEFDRLTAFDGEGAGELKVLSEAGG